MSLMASLVTTSRMQQCFNVLIDIYHEFLLLFYCCVLLEIKLTTTTSYDHWAKIQTDGQCGLFWSQEVQACQGLCKQPNWSARHVYPTLLQLIVTERQLFGFLVTVPGQPPGTLTAENDFPAVSGGIWTSPHPHPHPHPPTPTPTPPPPPPNNKDLCR